MSVIGLLNDAIANGSRADCPIPADEAREALRMIELFPTAAAALRTLVQFPGDKEAKKHAERCIALLDESEARAAKAKAPKPPAGSDLSDLG